jgi:predicted  nucleic acid-binding Zn-ribbon protein
MEWLWLLSRKQRMLVEILNKLEQIMAKQADQDRAIAGLRTAFETEKTEIRAALDALTTEISSLRTEGSISDASIAELDRIAQEIAGIIETPVPPSGGDTGGTTDTGGGQPTA